MRVMARLSFLAKASNRSREAPCVDIKALTLSEARLGSMMRFTTTMPARTSSSSNCVRRRLVSSSANCVGMATTTKEVRSGSVKRDWSSIMRNWKVRNWSVPSPSPASHPKRSRKRAMRSARRSRKSGKLRSLKAWPVGAVSMMIRSNFSCFTSSRTSTSATISSLPGGRVSKRFTKSSIGNCCSTWPTMPPAASRRANASRTVAWKRFMADAVSTSMAQSSPAPAGVSTCMACPESWAPKASPRE
mmetsp:Transcript_91180/g.195568  ORF Transcript_91180/g.195568 Transcript_91180/m.195568 type:complete len:246 (-) Transcript_91180:104-841(-)